MSKHWVCSRCARDLPEGLGRRFRFAGETCPTCSDPGVGMVLVDKPASAPPCPSCNDLGFKEYDGLAVPSDCYCPFPEGVTLGAPVPPEYSPVPKKI